MQAHDVTLAVVSQMAKKIVYTSQTVRQVLRQGCFVYFVQFLSALLRIVQGTMRSLIHLFR